MQDLYPQSTIIPSVLVNHSISTRELFHQDSRTISSVLVIHSISTRELFHQDSRTISSGRAEGTIYSHLGGGVRWAEDAPGHVGEQKVLSIAIWWVGWVEDALQIQEFSR